MVLLALYFSQSIISLLLLDPKSSHDVPKPFMRLHYLLCDSEMPIPVGRISRRTRMRQRPIVEAYEVSSISAMLERIELGTRVDIVDI